ncbi:alkanesulfonate monooxygenase SsuD/methylene tetrahydromethanopterin reductase-like flavin-dependent oxidoreductase (luciferase family) [Mycobacterium sp. OAS707]|uniref:LLM class flavin-dependent oxidoreductase n=1 Tax=unclassified Mycobacterium TaxID=2642494 RepID=UPI00178A2A9A|nr:LLM class flavin-dependent oxidoreductase [Mycobacterium sp. OAS707]MBE1551795.1 alkanesulfonate monooxygenase SsuD/methylene tetrahydromethanopterin reductase-like flavin-dependent oxidoreductase (luciferase family) [Mycobacterium sp. OAS707]
MIPKLGFKLDGRPAEHVIRLARSAEQAGFDELWVCEDLALAGGIAQAAAALAVTTDIVVGLGIAPAAVRNPMYLAMEFASVARLSAGRFHAGIGHGMPAWLRQVGQHPDSLMVCLAEVSQTVRDLLRGDLVSYSGRHVRLDGVSLTHPPAQAPPLSLGVRGPKGIELAGELGFGVILAEGSPPEYVAEVRKTLGPDAHITVFVWSNLDTEDAGRGVEALLPIVQNALQKPYLAAQLGNLQQADCDLEVVSQLTVSGDTSACEAAIARLAASGADAVVLQPIHGTEEQQIEAFGTTVLQSRDIADMSTTR